MTDETCPEPKGALLKIPGFRLYVVAILFNWLAIQIQTVAVGWQVYDMTRNPFDLGLVGLSQFAPALCLVLVTGAVADRFSRRLVMGLCLLVMAFVSGTFWWLTRSGSMAVTAIFVLMVVYGASRAFYNPTRQSLIANIVPPEHLPGALATTSTAMQVATICGPVAGGLLYGLAAEVAYGTSFVLLAIAAVLVLAIPKPAQNRAPRRRQSWQDLTAGFSFIRQRPIILGAISLDLFVVLLGGAFALLPVYARDVLDVGIFGLGVLRAAPAIGAIAVALLLMARPIRRHAGRTMFACVGLFSFATLVFGLSTHVWLSVAALVIIGATDVVSVIIRQTLIQLHTPDELRGRVSAVNTVFIGASNELGEFRAGSMAALFGPVVAVAGGALVSLGICALWMRLFPTLRNVDTLSADTSPR
ncbi:MFS transporter [uncultured Paracoccus sp.]|uniref:MFS transporter n=1 Tax=uncultured Paracoccus sp. TaxID=189685 RepID=UPI00261189FB|nr:MFS transporter [uncultured Paracoccus sp.]